MLSKLELVCARDFAALPAATRRLRATFPDLTVVWGDGAPEGVVRDGDAPEGSPEGPPAVEVGAARWRNPAFDLLALDREVAETIAGPSGPLVLRLVDDGDSAAACASAALEVVTRY